MQTSLTEEGAYDLFDLYTNKYVGPASDIDVAAFAWWVSKGRPWIVRGRVKCRVGLVVL